MAKYPIYFWGLLLLQANKGYHQDPQAVGSVLVLPLFPSIENSGSGGDKAQSHRPGAEQGSKVLEEFRAMEK